MTEISASELTRKMYSSPIIVAARIATSWHEGWKHAKIATIAENMSTGTTPPSKNHHYYGGEIQWFTPSDIGGIRWLKQASKTITQESILDKKARLFSKGTVLVTCIGQIGRLGITIEPCSANQQITGIKFKEEIDPEFAYYSLFSRRNELENAAPTATTLPILNQKRLGDIDFFYPSLAEQKQIVKFLIWCENNFLGIRKSNLEECPRLPEYLSKLPLTIKRVEELVGKIEEVRSLRQQALEETEAFVISLHLSLADSKMVTLDEIITLDEQQEQVLFGKQYPQVGVKGFGGGLFAKDAIDATQTAYKAFNYLYEGALVLSQVKGWEGAIGVCPSYLVGKYVSPEYRTFRCIPGKAIPEYLSALVTTPWFWTKLKDLTRGMGGRRERTRPEQFLKMKIPMPTFEDQQKAIPIFNKIHKIKHLREKTLKELDPLLPSILDKAFKGEL